MDLVLQPEATTTPSCGPVRPAALWTCIPADSQCLKPTALPAVSKLDLDSVLHFMAVTPCCGPAPPAASWTFTASSRLTTATLKPMALTQMATLLDTHAISPRIRTTPSFGR